MKVILLVDVKELGKKGKVVEVAEGYGRNYLLPRGLAIEASGGNIKILSNQKAADDRKKTRELEVAKELAAKIDQITLVIKTKVGESGRLFGSVTSKELSELLQKNYKLVIDKRKIELKDSIKCLGTYNLTVKIHPEVQATLKINVIGSDTD